jgi:integrase
MVRGYRLIIVEGTKSGYLRKIPMNIKLTETLDRIRKENHSEFVLVGKNGKPYKSFRSAWEHVLEKAGIENLTFHSLRHTFGSRLGMAGVTLRRFKS